MGVGDQNQFELIRGMVSEMEGPFLEIGSKDYGSTQNLRSRVGSGAEDVGIDQAEGPGVDAVIDMTAGFDEVDRALGGKRFGCIICLSVLEHCRQPFLMAEQMARLLKPGGRVIISVPFAWKFHGFPSDYWRFTHEGVKLLFPTIKFDEERCVAVSSRPGSAAPLNNEIGRAMLSGKSHRNEGRILRALAAKFLRLLGRTPVFSWATGYRYILVPTMLFMTGIQDNQDEPAEG